MRIPLERESDVPLYQQVEDYFRTAILNGSLPEGERLPALRALAHELGVNRMTIETAYAGLEADGLVESRVGSGTYVLPLYAWSQPGLVLEDEDLPGWQTALADQPLTSQRLLADDLIDQLEANPQIIDLSSGMGDTALFPADEFRKVLNMVLKRDGTKALEYGKAQGFAPLRASIARVLASTSLQTRAENILITAGSQQALALSAQALLRPGDTVLLESPTYSGAIDLFRALDVNLVGVPLDEEGMQVELLPDLIETHQPSLIYTIPNFHNPSGICMSGARRRQLMALAEEAQIPILEDDFVGDLRYDGRSQPPLKALDPGGNVIYVSTFSKMLMTGLRVGFLVAEGPLYETLLALKSVTALTTTTMVQVALEEYVSVGRYRSHLRRSVQRYRRRRDVMAEALEEMLPECEFYRPEGGLFIWLKLPERANTKELMQRMLAAGVAAGPGAGFFPDPAQACGSYLRLNFAASTEEEISEGIRRLAGVVRG